MQAPVIDISIIRGKTFEFAYRYAEDELIYLPIVGIQDKAPLRLSLPGHGIPDGWPVRIESVKCPDELNTVPGRWQIATAVDADTIEINDINASEFKTFSGGGFVVFHRPVDLSGWSCRASIRPSVSSEEILYEWPSGGIDAALSAFVLHIPPEVTSDFKWSRGVYDIEAVAPSGDVYPITAVSAVVVLPEVTR